MTLFGVGGRYFALIPQGHIEDDPHNTFARRAGSYGCREII